MSHMSETFRPPCDHNIDLYPDSVYHSLSKPNRNQSIDWSSIGFDYWLTCDWLSLIKTSKLNMLGNRLMNWKVLKTDSCSMGGQQSTNDRGVSTGNYENLAASFPYNEKQLQ